jgi:hypothetical protein
MTTSADISLTFNDSLDIGLPQPLSVNTGITEIPELSIGLDPLTIEPLKPGEHVLVHVVALADQALEPDVRDRAEISIPGLSDSRVPIAVCRRERRTAATDNRRMPRSPGEDAHDPVASLKPGADGEATEAVLRNSETKRPSPCRVDLLLGCRGLSSTGRRGRHPGARHRPRTATSSLPISPSRAPLVGSRTINGAGC